MVEIAPEIRQSIHKFVRQEQAEAKAILPHNANDIQISRCGIVDGIAFEEVVLFKVDDEGVVPDVRCDVE